MRDICAPQTAWNAFPNRKIVNFSNPFQGVNNFSVSIAHFFISEPITPKCCPNPLAILRCAAEVVPWKERAKGYRNTETDNRNTYMILWRDIKMIKFIKNFRKDEAGAVTVDWVVLTAAVVGLGVAAYGSIETGASGLTSNVSTYMGSQNPN